jgi:hypothetical protein
VNDPHRIPVIRPAAQHGHLILMTKVHQPAPKNDDMDAAQISLRITGSGKVI